MPVAEYSGCVTDNRETFFDRVKSELAAYYLEPGAGPYQQSGRSSGAERWEDTRRCMADPVDRSGSYLDVGCANGLLLESVQRWVGERGLTIEPFGLDFIPELVELARERVTDGTFYVGNAWDWNPPRLFTFVRTNLEYVPESDRVAMVVRQLGWVEPGGRLIVAYYRNRGADPLDVPAFLTAHGFQLGGVVAADPSTAWIGR